MRSTVFILLLAVAIYNCDALFPKTSSSKSSKSSSKTKLAPTPLDTINKSLTKTLDKNNKTLTKFVAQTIKNADYYVNKIALDTTEAQLDISAQIQGVINATKSIYGVTQDTALMKSIDVSDCSAPLSRMYETAKVLEDAASACMAEKIALSQQIGEQIKSLTDESLKNFEDLRTSTATCSAGFISEVDETNSLACLQKISTKAMMDSYTTIPMSKLQIEAQMIQLKMAKTGIMMCMDFDAQQKFSEDSSALALEIKNCMDMKMNPPATAAPPAPMSPIAKSIVDAALPTEASVKEAVNPVVEAAPAIEDLELMKEETDE